MSLMGNNIGSGLGFDLRWTVGAIFTFGRSRMFGHEKLRPSAVDHSQSRRIKKPYKICHKSFDQ